MHMLPLHLSCSIWYQGLHSGKFQLVSTLLYPSVVQSCLLIMNTMSNLCILHSVFNYFRSKEVIGGLLLLKVAAAARARAAAAVVKQ